jgi:ribosome-associated protein
MATKKKTPAKKASGSKRPAGKRPAAKAPARKAPARPSGGGRPAFKAGGPKRGAKPGLERKLPRKYGPRRKLPRSIGREAAPPVEAVDPNLPDPARDTALAVAAAGLDKKAEEILIFDVRGLSSYTDYLVLMTADSDRQAGAVADHVDLQLKEAGHTKIAVEGYETGNWIIVDYGDVVTHVMGRETRAFYDLEGLWADAPRVEFKG